jgi:hypothetical protein
MVDEAEAVSIQLWNCLEIILFYQLCTEVKVLEYIHQLSLVIQSFCVLEIDRRLGMNTIWNVQTRSHVDCKMQHLLRNRSALWAC